MDEHYSTEEKLKTAEALFELFFLAKETKRCTITLTITKEGLYKVNFINREYYVATDNLLDTIKASIEYIKTQRKELNLDITIKYTL